MQGHMKSFIFVIAGAGLVSSALGLSVGNITISTACTTSLQDLLTSDAAACLDASALLSFFVSNNQSIPGTIDTWLTGLCAIGSCSNDTLSAIVTNVTTGCAQDLASFGVTSDISQEIIPIVQQVYPTVRKIACLKDETTEQLCATQTLNNLESVIGTLDISDLSFMDLLSDASMLISSGSQSLACTNCTKEAFIIAQAEFPDIVSQATSEASNLCGADFVDGELPDTISQTDTPGVFSTNTNGVIPHGPVFQMATKALILLSFAFMML